MPKYKYNLRRASAYEASEGIQTARRYYLKRPGSFVVELFVVEGMGEDVVVLYVEQKENVYSNYPVSIEVNLFVQGFMMWQCRERHPYGSIGFQKRWKNAARSRWLLEDCPLLNPEGRKVDYASVVKVGE